MEFGVISTTAIGRESVVPAVGRTDHEVGAIASRSTERAETVAERGAKARISTTDTGNNMAGIDAGYGSAERDAAVEPDLA